MITTKMSETIRVVVSLLWIAFAAFAQTKWILILDSFGIVPTTYGVSDIPRMLLFIFGPPVISGAAAMFAKKWQHRKKL